MIRNIFLVGLGGGIGSIARYLCQKWMYNLYPHPFPAGTFIINITGCFLIGIFWGIAAKSTSFTENWALLLMTGLCGGFTTFSAFTLESINLIRENRTGLFLTYLAASVILGLFATWIGIRLIKPSF